jgi:hypothetical protein
MATPRADREAWTIEDVAAEMGFSTRTIRRALAYRPHTVPAPKDSPTTRGGLRWSQTTVKAFMRATDDRRRGFRIAS